MELLERNLIIIGGAEDKEKGKDILKEVSNYIDKEKGNFVIAAVASENPEEKEAQYRNVFSDLGVKNISSLNVKCREDAFDNHNIDIIKKANLIFFTGGDQLRITSILGGTSLYKILKEKYLEGCICVGTSAGASVMGDIMIVTGLDEESPRKCTLKMAPGLGLIRGVIIDQHFDQRGRIGRLLTGIAENPESLGIGIDEDTAIVVNDNDKFKVIGSGAVYVIDGSEITETNVSEQHQNEVLSIFNLKMHVLKNGNMFNFKSKFPVK